MRQEQLDQCRIGTGVMARVEAAIDRLRDVQNQEEVGASVGSLVAAIKSGINYVRDDWERPKLADKLAQKLKDKEAELGI